VPFTGAGSWSFGARGGCGGGIRGIAFGYAALTSIQPGLSRSAPIGGVPARHADGGRWAAVMTGADSGTARAGPTIITNLGDQLASTLRERFPARRVVPVDGELTRQVIAAEQRRMAMADSEAAAR
jgi:hypothetical protein